MQDELRRAVDGTEDILGLGEARAVLRVLYEIQTKTDLETWHPLALNELARAIKYTEKAVAILHEDEDALERTYFYEELIRYPSQNKDSKLDYAKILNGLSILIARSGSRQGDVEGTRYIIDVAGGSSTHASLYGWLANSNPHERVLCEIVEVDSLGYQRSTPPQPQPKEVDLKGTAYRVSRKGTGFDEDAVQLQTDAPIINSLEDYSITFGDTAHHASVSVSDDDITD